MILLDSSGLIDLLIDGPGGAAVEDLLRQEDVAIPSPNLAEVVDVMQRRYELAEDELRRAVEPLVDSTLALHEPDAGDAWRAGSIRARHYRRNRAVSMCDAILVGCGAGAAATVAWGDRLLLEIATSERVELIELG